MTFKNPSNQDIARLLDDIANLLETQEANPHKIRAYRVGARNIRQIGLQVAEVLLAEGEQAIQAMPGIGEKLSGVIEEYVRTGKSSALDKLLSEVSPVGMFEQVPGVGKELAERIVEKLGVKTLEELEQAAHDGRLAQVEGFGSRRVEAIKVSLAGMLSGFARRDVRRVVPVQAETSPLPPVSLLLEVDEEYREKAAAGELRLIAPKRFNPNNEAWLPIFNTHKDGWEFTALFSNTARAHDLRKTHDWVVIFFEKDGHEGQCTVVTETTGSLAGKRVVRGRERATAMFLENQFAMAA